MDSLNHVKIMTPDPEAVESFLREVCQIPEGWTIGDSPPAPAPAPAAAVAATELSEVTAPRSLTWEGVIDIGDRPWTGGYIVGSTKSRQFQVIRADKARIWAAAIGTRDLEGTHERAVARGIPVTEIRLVDFGETNIRAFFAEVGGVTFEILRVEPKA